MAIQFGPKDDDARCKPRRLPPAKRIEAVEEDSAPGGEPRRDFARRGRPRLEEAASTIEATMPWLKLGMSRRTWYRRRKETKA